MAVAPEPVTKHLGTMWLFCHTSEFICPIVCGQGYVQMISIISNNSNLHMPPKLKPPMLMCESSRRAQQSAAPRSHFREPAASADKLVAHEQNRVSIDDRCVRGSSPRLLSAITSTTTGQEISGTSRFTAS